MTPSPESLAAALHAERTAREAAEQRTHDEHRHAQCVQCNHMIERTLTAERQLAEARRVVEAAERWCNAHEMVTPGMTRREAEHAADKALFDAVGRWRGTQPLSALDRGPDGDSEAGNE